MTKRIVFSLVAALSLAGCVPASVQPQVTQLTGTSIGLGPAAPVVQTQWWTAYGDPQLDQLIGLGLAGNPSLDAALARVQSARADILANQAALLPQINGTGQIDRSLIGDKLLPSPLGGHVATLTLAGASLGWDLDLFGRQHAVVRSTKARAKAFTYDSDAARLAVSVSIAQTYVNYARATAQIQVTDGILATRQRSLAFVQSRRHANLASDFDVQTNETLVAQAQQASTRATRDRDVLVHALAALAGHGADFYGQIYAPSLTLAEALYVPEVIPADLLGRRPDLLAARARIDAAVGGRQAAAAAFMPDVNVTAIAGLASFGMSNFFTSGAGSWSAGPALSVPIFEGGRLKAQYEGATADLDAAVADYNNAVLGAVRDSADAVTNVREADQDLAEQQQVVAGLRNMVRLDQVRVSTGLGSRLDAIDSGFRLLEAEQDLIRLQANALTSRIQLVAALGGGFNPHAPDSVRTAKD
jgi:NodT family efflux transporter outer membrane factor (OMF) lipoprotein